MKKPPKTTQDYILHHKHTPAEKRFLRKSIKKILKDYRETFELLSKT